jgi:Tol biopolymer transport system component
MIDLEREIREALVRHELQVPTLDRADAPTVIRRTRMRQVVNGLGAVFVAALVAVGITSGVNALLRAEPSRPAHDVSPSPEPGPTTSPQPALDTRIVETFELDEKPGTYFVDVRSGEATPVPQSIVDLAVDWDTVGYQGTPDGSSLLFVGEDDRGRSQVFLATIDGSDVSQLTDEPEGAEAASLSPDGRTVVYVALSGTFRQDLPADLVVMDVATGDRTVILHAGGNELIYGRNELQYPRFSPDGRRILFTRGIGGYELWTIPVAGGEISRLLDDAYDAFPSPDGTTIAFHRDREISFPHGGTRAPQVWFADTDGSNARPFAGVNSGGPRWSPGGTWFAFQKAGPPTDPMFVDAEPMGLTGPGTQDGEGGLIVVELATGDVTKFPDPTPIGWLDDDTLIIELIAPRLTR